DPDRVRAVRVGAARDDRIGVLAVSVETHAVAAAAAAHAGFTGEHGEIDVGGHRSAGVVEDPDHRDVAAGESDREAVGRDADAVPHVGSGGDLADELGFGDLLAVGGHDPHDRVRCRL